MSDDEEILDRLGQFAREEAAHDPLDARWDALAADDLSPEDRAALAALAAADPEMAQAMAAFEPRGAALDDRIAAAIVQTVQAERPAPTSPAEVSAPRRRWALVAGLAAAAAVIALLLVPRGGDPLPRYDLEALAGEKVVRGVDAPAARYGPGSLIDLVIRPAQDTQRAVAVAAWDRFGDRWTRLPVQPTVAPNGVARLRGPVEAVLPRPPGDHLLLLVVGAPDDMPASADALRAALTESDPPWQVLEHSYRLVAR